MTRRESRTDERTTGLRGHRVLDPGRMSARREEILLALALVLAEKGYQSTTLDDVANRMGCSKAVIYYQFRSKEELYVALVQSVVENATERLAAIAGSGSEPEAQLRAALADLVHLGFQPRNSATIRMGRPTSLSKESRDRLHVLDRRYEGLFIDIVQRGMDAGVLVRRDPRLVAYTLINAVNSIFRWARPEGALTIDELKREVPEMLLNGVMTPAAMPDSFTR